VKRRSGGKEDAEKLAVDRHLGQLLHVSEIPPPVHGFHAGRVASTGPRRPAGASGSVGSIAIAILSAGGYAVTAVSGRLQRTCSASVRPRSSLGALAAGGRRSLLVAQDTVLSLYRTVITTTFEEGGAGALAYAWGPPGPHGWGGRGGFDFFTEDAPLCALLRSLAP
jgi:hypothetical protein